jgi:hypothetical protein
MGGTPQQAKSAHDAYQSETMVAVNMRDEDMAYFAEGDSRASYLQLGTLSAVDHKQFATTLHHLRRWVVTQGGQSAATT